MDKLLNILKKYWVFSFVAVGGVVLVIVLNLLFSKREVEDWDFGKKFVEECPFLGAYPLLLKNELPERYKPFLLQAVKEINQEVGKKLGMGKVYKLHTGSLRPFQVVVKVRAAPKSYGAFNKLCEPFKIANKSDVTQAGAVAAFHVKWKDGLPVMATIFVCVEKVKKGMLLMRSPVASRLKMLGWKGILKHELVHGIIGNRHPGWGGELMVTSPTLTTVSEHTLKIIGRHVVPVCKKNGRLSF